VTAVSRIRGNVGLAVAYFLCSEVARTIHVTDHPMSLIWPATGIAMGVMLLYGKTLWPGVGVATFATLVIHGHSVASAIWVSLVDVLEALCGVWVLQRVFKFHTALDRVRDAVALSVVAFGVSLFSSVLSIVGLSVIERLPIDRVEPLLSGWWWGHFSADLLVVPLILTWSARFRGKDLRRSPHTFELIALAFAVIIVDVVLFARLFERWFPGGHPPYFAPYYLLPLMLWGGIRFGPRGGATASFGVGIMALIGVAIGNGAFEQIADVQSFVSISAITTLILSAMAVERTRAVRRQASIQESALDAIVSVNVKGRIVEFNPAAERMFGMRAQDAIGQDAGELLVPERRRKNYLEMLRRYSEGDTEALEGRRVQGVLLDANRNEITVDIAIAAVTLNDELMMTGFIRDVTSQRAAEERNAEMLRQSERLAQLGSFELEVATGRVLWSDNLYRIFGRAPDSFVPTYASFLNAVHPDDAEKLATALTTAMKTMEPFDFEERILRPTGEVRVLHSHVMVFREGVGEPLRIAGCCQDVTEQRELERVRDHFADIARSSDDAIIGLTPTLLVESWNSGATTLFGYEPDEIIGKPVTMLAHPLSVEELERTLQLITAGEHVAHYEMPHVRKDGSTFAASVTMTAIRGRDGKVTGLSKVLRDISERISFENQLKASLHEKEVLLREIHHRVKNNLQVISSLLNLQVSTEPSPTTRRGLMESQSRIQSMALVHQLLYESRDLGHIDFTEYLRTLAVRLLGTYNVGPKRVEIRVEGESLLLEIDRAISCGLVVNELVANAIEHAFPDERSGHIYIKVERDGSRVALTVRDDGIGIPPQFTLERVQSFGLQIARTLTMQLDGTIDVRRENGTFVQISFPAVVRPSGQSALDAA
jgi:PAS domain S-box-containing protein